MHDIIDKYARPSGRKKHELISCLDFRSDDKDDITVDDLFLLCDLFYLPFEHGSRSLQIINEFYWLKSNATVLVSSYKKGQDISTAKPEVQEWFQRADKFYNICQSVIELAKKIAMCANKELCYDLFSYVWDMAGVVILLCAFIKWLGESFESTFSFVNCVSNNIYLYICFLRFSSWVFSLQYQLIHTGQLHM